MAGVTVSAAFRGAPNPRVQRTRPCASLRGSPLTRHPLGGPKNSQRFSAGRARGNSPAQRAGSATGSGVGAILLVSRGKQQTECPQVRDWSGAIKPFKSGAAVGAPCISAGQRRHGLELPHLRPPNPRVQRTRPSASLRGSPLTRHPLGRVWMLLLLTLPGIACSGESDWTGISVSAPDSWIDAVVSIDGQKVGTLQYLMLHDTVLEKSLKKSTDSPLFNSVALNVPINPTRSRSGVHRIRIEKPDRPSVEGEFTWPDPRGSKVQFLSVIGNSLHNEAGPDAKGSHP